MSNKCYIFIFKISASAVRSLWVLDNICHELQGYLNSEYLYQIFQLQQRYGLKQQK